MGKRLPSDSTFHTGSVSFGHRGSSRLCVAEVSSGASSRAAAGAEALGFGVAETVRVAGDGLDQAVGVLGTGVGGARRDEGEDLRPPGGYGGGQAFEPFERWADAGGLDVGLAASNALLKSLTGDATAAVLRGGDRDQVGRGVGTF